VKRNGTATPQVKTLTLPQQEKSSPHTGRICANERHIENHRKSEYRANK